MQGRRLVEDVLQDRIIRKHCFYEFYPMLNFDETAAGITEFIC